MARRSRELREGVHTMLIYRFKRLLVSQIVICCCLAMLLTATAWGQAPPYDVFPDVEPPYYRVRYEAETSVEAAENDSQAKGKLAFAVSYSLWLPPGVKQLRGVIVHQHGCGEGSCRSGLTGAYDLHWQALARKHACGLVSAAYEQPEGANCQLWCDPRNGSGQVFQQGLEELAKQTNHPELAMVPWALWGHSGGGHWAGGMVLLHPERVVAAWLRSGVPLLDASAKRGNIVPHDLPEAALQVPTMCNLGADEGYRSSEGRFASVWPANQLFFERVRSRGGLVGIAIDPLTSHECGNQRYLAIPWLDACLAARLPDSLGEPLKAMPAETAWLGDWDQQTVQAAASLTVGKPNEMAWLPDEAMAKAWVDYIRDTQVMDRTPPPVPTNVRLEDGMLRWEAEADLESGLAGFEVWRNGELLAELKGENPFGRPLFQNLQYSDTPPQPLRRMELAVEQTAVEETDRSNDETATLEWRVVAVNTLGMKSQ